MNRLQSQDFKTYAALSTPVAAFEAQRPKTDLEELRILGEAQGLGDMILDDGDDDSEFNEVLGEFGYTRPGE